LAARDFHATAGDQEGNRAEIKPPLELVVTFNRYGRFSKRLDVDGLQTSLSCARYEYLKSLQAGSIIPLAIYWYVEGLIKGDRTSTFHTS